MYKRQEDNILYDINYEEQLAIDKFPIQNSGLHIGTAAYHAERELDTLMYNDDTIFRDKQYDKARTVSLQTMDRAVSYTHLDVYKRQDMSSSQATYP